MKEKTQLVSVRNSFMWNIVGEVQLKVLGKFVCYGFIILCFIKASTTWNEDFKSKSK